MTTYTKTTDFAAKDALLTGNPSKLIKGYDLGKEFDNIAVADATSFKPDTVHSATSKSTPVDADELPIVDSATAYSLKKLTWANIKATLAAWINGGTIPGAFTTLSSTGTASFYGASNGRINIGAANNYIYGDTTGNMIIGTSGSDRVMLDASGNFGVGTYGSNGGVTLLPNSGGATIAVGHVTGITNGSSFSLYYYNATQIGSITQNGTTSVAYNTTSDHRLKTNVRPANAAQFGNIQFVDFEWIDGRHDCGVIADQLQSVYPDLVIGAKDATEVRQVEITPAVPAVLDAEGDEVTPAIPAVTEAQTFPVYQQVNYMGLIGRMGTVIQQQSKLIAAMEARLSALEAK